MGIEHANDALRRRGELHRPWHLWLVVGLCAAVWGAVEATLGWSMHALHIHGVRALMFPLGLACMAVATYRTGRPSASFLVAVIAAGIKLLDLLIGGHFRGVVSPAASMVIDGLAVAGFFAICNSRPRGNVFVEYAAGVGVMLAAFVGFGLWRAALTGATGGEAPLWQMWEPARLFPALLQVLLKALYLLVAWLVMVFAHARSLAPASNE